MLHWILRTFGKPSGQNSDPQKQGYRLQRIHFHCLTYHIMAWFFISLKILNFGLISNLLQRKIFFELTPQKIEEFQVSIGTDWTNSAAGLAAGARIAGRMSCNLNQQVMSFLTIHSIALIIHNYSGQHRNWPLGNSHGSYNHFGPDLEQSLSFWSS